jgi:hypothetical protein
VRLQERREVVGEEHPLAALVAVGLQVDTVRRGIVEPKTPSCFWTRISPAVKSIWP